MRVVVAGGRGFIGRAVVARLAVDGHATVAAGRGEVAAALAAGADALVWAAGRKHAGDAANRAEHEHALAEAILAAPRARVVYLSSGEVYGAQPVPFVEDAPTLGTTSYAQAKLAGEATVRAVGGTVLRPAIVYGPGQGGTMFVPSAVRALCAGERLPMTAGAQTRDLIFVDDVAAAVAAALAPGAPAGIYNVGTGVEVPLLAVAHAIADAVGPGARARLDVGAVPYRDGEQLRYALEPMRARVALGWSATTPLAVGLAATVAAAR